MSGREPTADDQIIGESCSRAVASRAKGMHDSSSLTMEEPRHLR
jgi:hypothetical protein